MRRLRFLLLSFGTIAGILKPVSAQVAGVATLPRFLIFSKAAIALDNGQTGGNSDVVGIAATALFGQFVMSAAGSMVFPEAGPSFGSYGASADVSQWIHLGVAHWDSAGVSHLHVPLGLTLPFAWCLRSDRAWLVWVGGRRDFQRVGPRSQSAYSDDAWAYTLGLTVETSARFGFHVAFDRTSRSNEDWSGSIGVHLGLRTLSKGTRTTFFSDTSTFKSDRPCGSLPGGLAGH
jgi:hypothetical protein